MAGEIQNVNTNVEVSTVKKQPKSEQKQTKQIFNGNKEVTEAKEKPLKPTDLNYENFKKQDRDDAMTKARDALNEIRDLVRDYNANYPAKAYVVDFSEFPRPEDYDSKQLGGKQEAFTQWKNDVDAWRENIKQDVAQLKSNNLDNLAKQQFKALLLIYERQGLTQEAIYNCYVNNNYNLKQTEESLKQQLAEKTKEIKRNTNSNAGEVKKAVKDDRQTKEADKKTPVTNDEPDKKADKNVAKGALKKLLPGIKGSTNKLVGKS